MVRFISCPHLLMAIAALAALMALAGCSSSDDETATLPVSTSVAPTQQVPDTMSATSEAGPKPRSTGEYDGISFIISDGSEATFTVKEQLVRSPLPNDAVMRTTALSGEIHLDGRPSVISIDLQKLSSDQEFRDSYVKNRMFSDHPTATFTVPDVGLIPEGLAAGEEVMTQATGSLDIRGSTFDLGFDIEARDDGDTMFILGRTTFTWDQLNIPPPTARSVASVEDEVRVEILLLVAPDANELLVAPGANK